MDEIREKRTVVHELPVSGRPVIENQYDQVSVERRGMSGAAIAAMIISAVMIAMFVTWLIVSNQQSEELAMERERALIAERNAAQAQAARQEPQQQPQQPIVVMPQSQPATVPVPVPVPVPAEPATTTPSNMSIEIEVNKKLLDDRELSTYPITVKVENGTATLEGSVPAEDLKTRAQKVAGTVKGVRGVINNITIRE